MVLVVVLHSGAPPPADEEGCETVDAPTPQALVLRLLSTRNTSDILK